MDKDSCTEPALGVPVVDKGSLSKPLAPCSLPEQDQEKQFPSWLPGGHTQYLRRLFIVSFLTSTQQLGEERKQEILIIKNFLPLILSLADALQQQCCY